MQTMGFKKLVRRTVYLVIIYVPCMRRMNICILYARKYESRPTKQQIWRDNPRVFVRVGILSHIGDNRI